MLEVLCTAYEGVSGYAGGTSAWLQATTMDLHTQQPQHQHLAHNNGLQDWGQAAHTAEGGLPGAMNGGLQCEHHKQCKGRCVTSTAEHCKSVTGHLHSFLNLLLGHCLSCYNVNACCMATAAFSTHLQCHP